MSNSSIRIGRRVWLLLLLAALGVVLAGCGGQSAAPAPQGTEAASPAPTVTPEPTPEPTPTPPPRFDILGTSYPADAEAVDLTELDEDGVDAVVEALEQMPAVRSITLGDDQTTPLEWDSISRIHTACPESVIDYGFSIGKKTFNLSDEEMDLKYVRMDDEGALVSQIAHCMTNLRFLDMDSCGVSNEAMAELRDSLPQAEVVWRVNFGLFYTARTNVERILASQPGKAGELVHNNVMALQYCTKVKYLDLGHNNFLDTIEFCRYMPDLEVLIVGMTFVEDFSPLAECPKLEYLEAMTSRLHDLTPLANLQNLRHLNICYNFALSDITPLYGLTGLERLWIGCYDPIPPEQLEEIRRRLPNCVINDEVTDPTTGGWRFVEWGTEVEGTNDSARYHLLRRQFGYTDDDFSFRWNDPLYDYTWHAPEIEHDPVDDFVFYPDVF